MLTQNEHPRKPSWLKIGLTRSNNYFEVARTLRRFKLHTVCEEAHCPNSIECWGMGTATFMILGSTCTRSCGFCSVRCGRVGEPVDPDEPKRLAGAVKRLGLKYVVITSVDRDDLPDGGAGHFADCINAVKAIKDCLVEVLIPDFQGNHESLIKIVESKPDVVGHNIETVRRLQGVVRDRRASYERSLKVLGEVKRLNRKIYTKSSLMVGLGESDGEVLESLRDLREHEVDIVTIGQYLQPTRRNLPVVEYVRPEVFEYYRVEAERLGFKLVLSGPLVRSSYHASSLQKLSDWNRL
ncbi:lipoyl synthase [Candidatus Bathyarchaeota archaeon]|nr:lipoyl synthase [Candidatus Bathyarchaeota archaeon]MBS7629865.1 lipoyl synthase [Candidatus Bathyarchaeota archaeon]